MPGFNIPANMDIFGFAAKRQAQPSLSSLLSDLVATRNTILRISSSILILIVPKSSAPLAVLLWSRIRPVASVLSIRTLVVLEQGPSRSVLDATFFSRYWVRIGLNLSEQRLCLCFVMRLWMVDGYLSG